MGTTSVKNRLAEGMSRPTEGPHMTVTIPGVCAAQLIHGSDPRASDSEGGARLAQSWVVQDQGNGPRVWISAEASRYASFSPFSFFMFYPKLDQTKLKFKYRFMNQIHMHRHHKTLECKYKSIFDYLFPYLVHLNKCF